MKARAIARVREDGTYRRIAFMLAAMSLLINVPGIVINTTQLLQLGDLAAASSEQLSILSSRTLLLQLLMTLVIAPPFLLSKTRLLLGEVNGHAGSARELFDGLSGRRFFVAIRATLWQAFLLYVWIMIPTSLMLNGYLFYQELHDTESLVILLLGAVSMLVSLIRCGIAYSQQTYLLADNDKPGFGAIISMRLSVGIMRGRAKEFIALNLRLLPFLLPQYVPVILSNLLYTDSTMFGLAMQLTQIALAALCMPAAELALADYFLQLKAEQKRFLREHPEILNRFGIRPDGATENDDDSKPE